MNQNEKSVIVDLLSELLPVLAKGIVNAVKQKDTMVTIDSDLIRTTFENALSESLSKQRTLALDDSVAKYCNKECDKCTINFDDGTSRTLETVITWDDIAERYSRD